jgi:hypothetical protein
LLAASLALCALSACIGGGGDSPADSAATPTDTSSGTPGNLSITGTFYAPDGTTPIANAMVYALAASTSSSGGIISSISNSGVITGTSISGVTSTIGTMQASSALLPALSCGEPPADALAATCTDPQGKFDLKLSGLVPGTVVLSKGAFKAEQTVSVSNGQTRLVLGAVSVPTSGINAARMAVVTGSFDSIEDVLAKLGFGQLAFGKLKLGTETFKIYNGDDNGDLTDLGYPSFTALFDDADGTGRADIFDYDIVFLNCGIEFAMANFDADKLATLQDYVQSGGRIYASDWSYAAVELAFPQFIDFMGSDETAIDEAEVIEAALLGAGGIDVSAQVDSTLKSWLQGMSCLNGPCVQADGTVHIEGFLGSWAVIKGSHAGATVKTWANGPVSYFSDKSLSYTTENLPLTMSFTSGRGRVTFTSYHNESGLIGDDLLPQQRILQYMVFEL